MIGFLGLEVGFGLSGRFMQVGLYQSVLNVLQLVAFRIGVEGYSDSRHAIGLSGGKLLPLRMRIIDGAHVLGNGDGSTQQCDAVSVANVKNVGSLVNFGVG